MLDVYWAGILLFIALIGAVKLVMKRNSTSNDDSDFNYIFMVFGGVTIAFLFLTDRAVDTGLFGLRDILPTGSLELQNFTLIAVAGASWLASMFVLIFGPMLFMDDDLKFTLRNPAWLKSLKSNKGIKMTPNKAVLLVVFWVVLGPFAFTWLTDTLAWCIDSLGIESGIEFFLIFTMPMASILAVAVALTNQKQRWN